MQALARWWRSRDLRTRRLRLVAMTEELLAADAAGSAALARSLRARVGAQWPPQHWEPHVIELIAAQLREHPETLGWNRYVLLEYGGKRELVGAIGGFPKAEGDVETGYSTLPEFQRRGLGTGRRAGAGGTFAATEKRSQRERADHDGVG